jgi:hypothetical protein
VESWTVSVVTEYRSALFIHAQFLPAKKYYPSFPDCHIISDSAAEIGQAMRAAALHGINVLPKPYH